MRSNKFNPLTVFHLGVVSPNVPLGKVGLAHPYDSAVGVGGCARISYSGVVWELRPDDLWYDLPKKPSPEPGGCGGGAGSPQSRARGGPHKRV